MALDLGPSVSSAPGITISGSTPATAYLIHKKITVVVASVADGMLLLPQSCASGTVLKLLNRSGVILQVHPGTFNQVENLGVGVSVPIGDGTNPEFTSLDSPTAAAPRTWWMT